METQTEIETQMDMETETETDNKIAKYFIWRHCPYSAIWNVSEISRRNFQWRYILVAPLH
jgi:hypothetical protein